ncbi:unnamed protein product [Tilletia laevis]|uniref:Uncharacterized protein n=2 Tax=Tilletia TaxID=13289 RepID=A0A8X7STE4_9BASI|nr:hypothetical protein CF336_g8135 [Tilletia laevis]KAE8239537.1 hypothetical protein A4X06_0g8215 [Tilletia controversa]CAD6896683.1 unnamed protein product [Tilletia laevis]CAD6904202.1 unnamed protein product [Tilletia controversa]CAD6918577.1 unnamed protein product [Tilletia controversa]
MQSMLQDKKLLIRFRRADQESSEIGDRNGAFFVPIQYDALRAAATRLFPPKKGYKVAFSYFTNDDPKHPARKNLLMDEWDLDGFNLNLEQGNVPKHVIVKVHHLHYNRDNGRIDARMENGKKVEGPGDLFLTHVKLEHASQQMFIPRKDDEGDQAEYVGRRKAPRRIVVTGGTSRPSRSSQRQSNRPNYAEDIDDLELWDDAS